MLRETLANDITSISGLIVPLHFTFKPKKRMNPNT